VPENIRNIFAQVSGTYERLNHILTFGFDVASRKRAARIAAAGGGTRWADLCTGTGETAAYLCRLAPPGAEVHAVDFCEPMLAEARTKPEAGRITFHVADVTALPFADASFDLLTMSFATRNINTSRDMLIRRFAEFRRVLKPGGRFVNLETSQPSPAPLRAGFHAFVKLLVERVGARVSGSRAAYAYLAHTIPRFYGPEQLADLLRQAGFAQVSFRRLFCGIAAIHQAIR